MDAGVVERNKERKAEPNQKRRATIQFRLQTDDVNDFTYSSSSNLKVTKTCYLLQQYWPMAQNNYTYGKKL